MRTAQCSATSHAAAAANRRGGLPAEKKSTRLRRSSSNHLRILRQRPTRGIEEETERTIQGPFGELLVARRVDVIEVLHEIFVAERRARGEVDDLHIRLRPDRENAVREMTQR